MKTISRLYKTIGPIRFFTRTNRLQLDAEWSIAVRTMGVSPGQGQAIAVLFIKRVGMERRRVIAALFLEWMDEDKYIPYAFFHPEQGTILQLYRTNSRGRVVGIRAAFRSRLEELAKNWDTEFLNALSLKRFVVPTLRLVKQ